MQPHTPFAERTHHLSVAEHVARREARRMVEDGRSSLLAWDRFLDGLMRSVMRRYAAGRCLSGPGYAATVSEIRATLRGLSPTRLSESSLTPTRTRPKREEHEFLALVRYGNPAAGLARVGFLGLRIHVTRKRVAIDQEFVGLDITRHALERAGGRSVVRGPDGMAQVEAALAAHAGLVVAWRWAMLSRGVTSQVALPIGDGLILGSLERFPSVRMNLGYRMDRNGISTGMMPQNDLQVTYEPEDEVFLPFLGTTVVDEDLLRIPQVDLRDALAAFGGRHRAFLDELGGYASWAAPALHRRESFAALRQRMDVLADELAAILARPSLKGVLEPRPAFGDEADCEARKPMRLAYPSHLMADPDARLDRVCSGLGLAA